MSTDYEDYDEPDYDGYDTYKDDLAMGYILEDGTYREPEPSEEQIWRYEHEKYLRGLSPFGRLTEPARAFIWRHTWRWRLRTGSDGPFDDEPPF